MTGMILIDLQKTFDFSKHVVNWFQSYLSNKSFLACNNFSQPASVSCGVPQGSILGRLLFLIFVNDMSQAVKSDLFLHVNDTFLACQHKDLIKFENLLNKVFCNICAWFVDNKLIKHFGEGKTRSILFASKFKRKNIKKLKIKYGDIQIKLPSKVKYLVCVLDKTMSGEALVLNVVNRFNNKLKILYCKNSFLTPALTHQLCNR